MSVHRAGQDHRENLELNHSGVLGCGGINVELSSTAFVQDARIPTRFTGDGDDTSPALAWGQVAEATREFALICDDPDAPTPEPWVHWILLKIPGHWRLLPEGIGNHAAGSLPDGLRQGLNSWSDGKRDCYRGPLPPPGHGVHHYHFKLYALDQPLDLPHGVTKKEVLRAIDGHVIEMTEVVGTYER